MRLRTRFEPTLFVLLLSSCSPAKPEAPPEAPATAGNEQLPPAPVAETPPAPLSLPEPAAPPHHAMPPFAAIVSHEVKDFDAWKATFDGHVDVRKQASIIGHALMRGVDNDKLVAVYFPATDADKLQTLFNQSPDLAKLKQYIAAKETKQAMTAAGARAPTVLVVRERNGHISMTARA